MSKVEQPKNTKVQTPKTPWNEKYEKLKKLHKVITDSISAVDKDLNQTKLEWLQFCSLVEKQNSQQNSSHSSDVFVTEAESDLDLLTKFENSALINTQPIDVNIKIEHTQVMKYQVEEEFDSD